MSSSSDNTSSNFSDDNSSTTSHPQTSPFRTIIIYDWDDTLFPTRFIKIMREIAHDLYSLPNSARMNLEALEIAVIELLTESLYHGKVVIISNATENWLWRSQHVFFPRVAEFLQHHNIKVISTRDRYGGGEHAVPRAAWKYIAFKHEIEQVFGTAATRMNILVIGDSHYEITAARALAREFPRSFVKKIMVRKTVLLEYLKCQLEFLRATMQSNINRRYGFNRIVNL